MELVSVKSFELDKVKDGTVSGVNPAVAYLGTLKETGRRAMETGLRTILDVIAPGEGVQIAGFDWSSLRYEHTTNIRARLIERGYAYNTINLWLSGLRRVLKTCYLMGLADANEMTKAIAVPNVRGNHTDAGRVLTEADAVQLITTTYNDTSTKGLRDGAILALAYGSGLRRIELVNIKLDDLDTETGRLVVKHGKGNKSRVAYLPAGSISAVLAWLEVRGSHEGYLFNPVRKGGAIGKGKLSKQAIYNMVTERAERANLGKLTPHDLRRSFGTNLSNAGVDLETVQRTMGHASPATTTRYIRKGEGAIKDASDKLFVPTRN